MKKRFQNLLAWSNFVHLAINVYPAGTQPENNVVSTLMRCHVDAVMCLLSMHLYHATGNEARYGSTDPRSCSRVESKEIVSCILLSLLYTCYFVCLFFCPLLFTYSYFQTNCDQIFYFTLIYTINSIS